ncbi:protein kinase domain-containing protein [Rhodococcus zopfii]|uniref:protein kinase domain-containing protein n=1 Tax=Rhodococcus zopfii TaxID=43772 RepID=UPI003528EE9A
MVEQNPLETQRAPILDVTNDEDAAVRDLEAAGFTDPEEIGRGGFGVVYRCRQEELDRTVAVKVLGSTLEPENLERFLREQRAMGRLSGHPHIVTVLQAGSSPGGKPYLVMHYHPHDSLEARIRRHGPLPWRDVLRIGVKLAGALETAHRAGILHRDVKPANILITEYGEPQLTDFGIARVAGGFRTTSRQITGSPAFTAPEIIEGKPPAATADVYALSATLFCALTGHAAFERREGERVVAQFVRITTEPIPDLRGEGIPDDVCAAIEQGMATDPAERPPTAFAFGDLLRQVEEAHSLDVDEMALPSRPDEARQPLSGSAAHPTGGPPTGTMSTGSQRYAATGTAPSTTPATRFRPPATTRQLVPRTRLIDLLRAGERRRLTAIHAPAGFGKSTLAAQWRDVLTGEGVPVAWLAVDHDDNKLVWFLTHVIEALRQVRPALARQLTEILETHGDDDPERYVLSALIDELHRQDMRTALVIDDWHLVTSPETIAALDFLLDRGCHHLQIVVTSRSRTGLPLSRMRVRDELVEIDSDQLRFDLTESDSFLRDVSGLRLDHDDVDGLTRTTDGWAAALQLASLSLRDSDDPAGLIEHLSGRHHAIGEFLADNVLATLEPEMYEFLLATSIPERISGSLASALADTKRGQAMLEEAEECDLFLRHLDDERIWFGYHHLFREFLRRRLERDHPDRIPDLHCTAARWFARHRMLSEAVDHALAADDEQLAVDLVTEGGLYLAERSHLRTLLALLDKLPPRAVTKSPRLQLNLGWGNVPLQRLPQAKRALDDARKALTHSNLPESDLEHFRIEADVLEAATEMHVDRPDRIEELIRECLDDPDALPPWVPSAAADFGTYCDLFRFDFAGARRRQEEAERFHKLTKGTFAAVYGRCLAGIAASEQLDLVAAESIFRAAVRTARRDGGPHCHSARLASSMLGELLYEQGRIAEAEELLDESRHLGAEGGTPDFMIARFVTAARLKAVRGDRAAATALLDEGAKVAADHDLPRLRARIDNERMRLGLPTPAPPSHPMPDDDTVFPNGVVEVTTQIEDATSIRLLSDRGDPESLDRACEWAHRWHRRVRTQNRPRAELMVTRLLVGCLFAAGRTEEAEQRLAGMVHICGERGMLRYLVDGGKNTIAVLGLLHTRLRENRWRSDWPTVDEAFVDEVLRLAGSEITDTAL